jgi:hypothetical protein
MVLRLTFDRAVDIDAIDVTQFEVFDGVNFGFQYVGTEPATLVDPVTVEINLNGVTEYAEPNTILDATAANGIVASGDGAEWAGAADLALPFP